MKPASYSLLLETPQLASPAVHARPETVYRKYGKRFFDLCLVCVSLPFVVPLIGVIWCLVKTEKGPAFYGHIRVGRGGVPFTCWKLRTMQTDADVVLEKHLSQNQEARLEWNRDRKLTHDPRVSRLGRFLRRTSLDELPQVWNVLRGDMSVVGPRPVVTTELARYGRVVSAYLSVRPGITGSWQVSGRNTASYDERVALDAAYVAKISWRRDLKIILLTALCVIKFNGK